MKVIKTDLQEVLLLEPRVFEDARGVAFESYNRRTFQEATGLDPLFVQDNRSTSRKNVLRGLHYQVQKPQGKLISVLRGEIYDVAVDLRRSATTFGKWVGFRLSESDRRMAWLPRGFAHGFQAMTEDCELLYAHSDPYQPASEGALNALDPALAIRWPLPLADMSERDRKHAHLAPDFQGIEA